VAACFDGASIQKHAAEPELSDGNGAKTIQFFTVRLPPIGKREAKMAVFHLKGDARADIGGLFALAWLAAWALFKEMFQRGSQSSKRFPSGSVAQPKRP
jgi:hypothetical protein